MKKIYSKLSDLGIINSDLLIDLFNNNKFDIIEFENFLDNVIENKKDYSSKLNLQLEKSLNLIPSSIFIMKDKNLLFANDNFKIKFLNKDNGTRTLELFLSMINSEDIKLFDKSIYNIENNKSDFEKIKIRFSTDGKKIYWIEICFSGIIYKDIEAIQIVAENISEKVQTDIQREIITKMMLDAEKKSFETEKMVERSAKIASVGVIASGITHEINQPLNAIKVGSDGLLIWNMQHPGVFPR